MSNSKIEDTILTAIDILVDKKISSAEFDQTIKGVIERCENEALGKYLIRYQDSIIAAYSSDIDKKYQQGQNVYITVPKGDMKNDKIIIGTAEAGSVTFINNEGQDNNYLLNGYNLLSFEENKTWGLWSQYKYPDTIILYDYEDDTNRQVQVDIQGINRDIKSASHLFFSAKVQTELPLIQRYNGQYGIILQILFKSNKDGITEITRQYILDSNKMVGNPYDFTYPIEQKAYFEIDGQNFIRINKITLFVKDFIEKSDEEEKIKSDIFISDLKIMTAQQLSEQDKNGVVLNLIARKGYIFGNTALPTDERTIQAQVKIQSKTVNLEAQSLPFYWFVENGSITANSVGYVKYGGQGWYCLNDSYEIDEGVIKYNSGKPTFTIKNQDILTTETKYKCVVIYENVAFSKEFTINKMGAAYNLQIQSDQGFQFRYDSGSPILKCIIRDSNNEIIPDEEVAENFTFIWSSITKANVFYTEDSNTNTLQNIDVAEIVGFTTYKCSVFTSEELGQQFIGTASATLTNLLEGETKASLVINNGQQLFSYDESGASPMNRDVENPIVYPELTFTIYDENNMRVSDEAVARLDKEWIVPAKNTMLVFPEKSGQKILSDDEQSYIFKNQNSLFYQIADKYSPYNINNTIQLRVDYNGTILTTQTDFIFLKQGDPGTNGTEYQVRIIPNTNSVFNGYPTIYACSTVQNTIIPNWDLNNGTSWFAIELWESGEKIFSGVNENSSGIEIEWSILKNDTDISFYDINSNSGVLSANYTNISNFINNNDIVPANIIRATVTYENHKYYATLPLITVILPVAIRQYNSLPLIVQLKENGGFRFVKYDTDGTKPAYNDHTPFEILTQREENDSYINFIYNNCKWKSISSFQNKVNIETYKYENKKYILDNNAHQIYQIKQAHYFSTTAYRDCEINQIWMTPKNLCDGAAVTNALLNTFTDSSVNNQTVYVHIPVHFLLNRFFNAALNDWDGNSVNLGDQNGGMILAPQIGAGQKDNNNRFTGIVMGKRVTNTSSDIGLFGYNQGQQSIFLDAKTGRSTFGTENLGQIIIDPGSTQAIIKGGRYVDSSTNGTGMAINFSSGNDGPWIRYGSRKFMVDKDGVLSATGVNISGTLTAGQNSKIGPWNITSTSIWKGSSTYGQSGSGNMYFGDDGLSISNKFKVSNSGNLTVSSDADITGKITATQGYIGGTSGWIIIKNKIYSGTVDSGGNEGDVTLSTSNFSRTIGGTSRNSLRFAIGSKFGVSNSGVLYASGGSFNGTITSTDAVIGSSDQYFKYQNGKISWQGANSSLSTAGIFTIGSGDNSLSYTSTGGLIIKGNITANSGSFNGTITSTNATIGGNDQYFKYQNGKISWQGTNSSLSTAGIFTIGDTSSNHYLQYNTSELTIKGKITSTEAHIGDSYDYLDFNSTTNAAYITIKTRNFLLDSSGNLSVGSNFSVSSTGILKAEGADIAGTITSTDAVIGTDNQYFKYQNGAISWKGTNTTFENGTLTATSVVLTGTIKSGMTGFNDTTNDGYYLGSSGLALGKGAFKVSNSGVLTSKKRTGEKLVLNAADFKAYASDTNAVGHLDLSARVEESNGTVRNHVSLQAKDQLIFQAGSDSAIYFRLASMGSDGSISGVKNIAYITSKGLNILSGYHIYVGGQRID